MRQHEEPMTFGLAMARELVDCRESDWPDKIGHLLIKRELSSAVREINSLLLDPQYRAIATSALKRIGLWDQLAPTLPARQPS